MRVVQALFVLAATVGVSGPATAAPKAADPNQVVCEKITVVGSRLATKRVCATRAEWAERRKLDRETIDRAQMAPNGPCQTVNTHSGAAAC